MFARLRWCLLLALLGAWSVASHAQMDAKLRAQLTGFEQVGPNEYRRTTAPSGSGGSRLITPNSGGALVSDTRSLALRAGTAPVTATAQLSRPVITRMGATLLRGLPVIGMGIAVWDLWDYNFRVQPKGDGVGLIHDPGVEQGTVTGTTWFCQVLGDTVGPRGSASGACQERITAVNEYNAAHPTDHGGGTISWRVWTLGTVTETTVQVIGQDTCTGPAWWCPSGLGGPVTSNGTVWSGEGQVTQCPASVDPSNPAYSIPAGAPPDPVDGKCRTARYHHTPITVEGAGQLGDANQTPFTDGIREDIVDQGLSQGQTPDVSARGSSGPASQTGSPTSTTTTNPDNSTTTVTKTPTYTYNYGGDQITVTTTTVTVTNNGGDITTTTETTGDPAAPAEEIITCGLPGKPKCIIDETGTPEAPADTSTVQADALVLPVKNCVLSPTSCFPALPDLNWSFSLPTGCQPIPVAAFSQWMPGGIDLCPFQPMVHDIMSMIWAAGGLFAGIGMMFRGSQ